MSASLSLVRETQATFNPREGHAWRIAAEQDDNSDDEDVEQGNRGEQLDKNGIIPSVLVTGQEED